MFYGFLVLTIVLYMTGHKVPGNILMVIFLGVPVILFVFKEPLGNLVTKQHKKMEEGKVMFFVQALLRTVRDDAELFLQYHFLCAYRCICRQPCGDDGGCADVIRRKCGTHELDRVRAWKCAGVRTGRSGRRYPGTASGIL